MSAKLEKCIDFYRKTEWVNMFKMNRTQGSYIMQANKFWDGVGKFGGAFGGVKIRNYLVPKLFQDK